MAAAAAAGKGAPVDRADAAVMLAAMAQFVAVSPNVALDRRLVVPGFAEGGVWRAAAVALAAGGKGINVARGLVDLGADALAVGPLGGATGAWIAARLAAEGIAAAWTAISGETRTCLVILDGGGGTTVVNEPGPRLDAGEWQRFTADVGRRAAGARFVAISGSLPPLAQAEPAAAMAALIAQAAAGGAQVWVDSSGGPLAAAVQAAAGGRLAGLKINAEEAATLLARPIADAAAAATAGRQLRQAGVDRVAITLGAAGAVLVTGDGAWLATPPAVPVVSSVGAGDAFMAGLLAAVAAGAAPPTALTQAVAAGAANVGDSAAGAIAPDRLAVMAATTVVRPLPEG